MLIIFLLPIFVTSMETEIYNGISENIDSNKTCGTMNIWRCVCERLCGNKVSLYTASERKILLFVLAAGRQQQHLVEGTSESLTFRIGGIEGIFFFVFSLLLAKASRRLNETSEMNEGANGMKIEDAHGKYFCVLNL